MGRCKCESDQGRWSETPLYAASQEGHMNVVAVLVSADANVNQAQTDDGATPLYVASQEGHTDVVAAFVSVGADVNQNRDD